jgi:hypothetical protein
VSLVIDRCTPRRPPKESAIFAGLKRVQRSAILRVPRDRDLPQASLPCIDEDEDVAVACIRPRRGHELGEWIVVELLVHDDPHADAVRPHHGEDQRVALVQPGVADRHLL